MRYPLVLLVAAAALAQDWPQILGPGRDGLYQGPFKPDGAFNKLWSRDIGDGFSGAVVANGRVLVYHRQGAEDKLESLDPATGKTQWTYAYAATYRDQFGFNEGPRSTPTVAGDRVFIYSAEGILQAVTLATGKKAWSVDARKEFGIRQEFFGTACSPLADGSRLLMNIGGAKGAGIVAIDQATGKTLWKALDHESGYSSPVAATMDGERHALFFTREGLVDADPATGRVRFQHKWRARMAASVNAALPIVAGNQVFLSSSYDTGAVLLEIQGDKARVVWSGDEILSNHYATSVLHEGHLYGFDGRQEEGQRLRCVEWKSGKVKWTHDGIRAGTVTIARGHLLVVGEQGEATVAPATPAGFKPVKKFTVADQTVRAYPALSSGRMFVRSDSRIAAFKMD